MTGPRREASDRRAEMGVSELVKRLGVDESVPHTARMYDAYLGGKDNYPADRDAVAAVREVFPPVRIAAAVNREFMHRAIGYLGAEQGLDQFLDIGTGIPTKPNVHQVAQGVNPAARVVYVDHDPLVLAHARALMTGTPEGRTAFIQADVREPEAILSAPDLAGTLDLGRPVALSLVALLHFVSGDRAYEIVTRLVDALAPGSFLVLTHMTGDFGDGMNEMARVYRERGLECVTRSRGEFSGFFDGLRLVDPGIVPPHRWPMEPAEQHPKLLDCSDEQILKSVGLDVAASLWAGVGQKP